VVAVLLLAPGRPENEEGFTWPLQELLALDKLAHALLFFALTRSLAGSLESLSTPPSSRLSSPLLAAILSLSYGLGLELLQLIVPNREVQLGDAIANFVGVSLYVAWRRLV